MKGMVGEGWISIKVLPLHRARLIRLKRWRVGSDSEPEQGQREQTIVLIVAIKSSAKPLRVSAMRGMQARPLEWQLGRFGESLR